MNDQGKGTVSTPEGVFQIPASRIAEAMGGDTVQIKPLAQVHGTLPQAVVTHVLDRATTTFAARYVCDRDLRVLVVLDDRLCHDFLIDAEDDSPARLGVAHGDVVKARIVRYPTRRAAGVATIERVIDTEDGGRVAIESIIATYDLAVEFPPAAIAQAKEATVDVQASLAEEPMRRDLRDRFVVTVDPDDARDYDDAVSCERLSDGGWLLGVHIADVSAYVPWGSPLDLEARTRGTSVYLADRVLPMLPEELSCDVCSLVANEDRLAVTVDLALDARGRVMSSDVYPSVIRSRARLTYTQVDCMLQAPNEEVPGVGRVVDGVVLPEFFSMLDTIRRLRQTMRLDRGAIEFVTSEAKAALDDDGHPVRIDVRRPTPATTLIEESMLAANEAVARKIDAAGYPSVFRVHESPAADSMAGAVEALARLDVLDARTRAGLLACDPHAIQAAVDAVRDKPVDELVSMVLLRAMRRAVYAPTDDGHFGLGAPSYCHFTSPIRRYPDLMAHRAVKAIVCGGASLQVRREVESALPFICSNSSKTERVAATAALESQSAMIARYMADHVGEVFSGVVVSVQPFGAFVRLDGTCAEGLIHVRGLGEGYWAYDDAKARLVNADTGHAVTFGQRVNVRVRSCDVFRGRIELVRVG